MIRTDPEQHIEGPTNTIEQQEMNRAIELSLHEEEEAKKRNNVMNSENEELARKALFNTLVDTANPLKLKKDPVLSLPPPTPVVNATPYNQPFEMSSVAAAAAAAATATPGYDTQSQFQRFSPSPTLQMPTMAFPATPFTPQSNAHWPSPMNAVSNASNENVQMPTLSQPSTQTPVVAEEVKKPMTEEDIAGRKSELMDDFRLFASSGILPPVVPKYEMSLEMLEKYHAFCEEAYEDRMGVLLMGSGFVQVIRALELINERFDPVGKVTGHGFKLKGAAKKMEKDMDKFKMPFTKIYRKYLKSRTIREVSPFLEVAVGMFDVLRKVHNHNVSKEMEKEAERMANEPDDGTEDPSLSGTEDNEVEEKHVHKHAVKVPPPTCTIGSDGFDPTNAGGPTSSCPIPKPVRPVPPPKFGTLPTIPLPPPTPKSAGNGCTTSSKPAMPGFGEDEDICITIPKSPRTAQKR
ncbi:MAG: hypothetical protein PHN45_08790 [Methylococcales bacterium]|nr:hypothetical protein [Methylococcales bacterium]